MNPLALQSIVQQEGSVFTLKDPSLDAAESSFSMTDCWMAVFLKNSKSKAPAARR